MTSNDHILVATCMEILFSPAVAGVYTFYDDKCSLAYRQLDGENFLIDDVLIRYPNPLLINNLIIRTYLDVLIGCSDPRREEDGSIQLKHQQGKCSRPSLLSGELYHHFMHV